MMKCAGRLGPRVVHWNPNDVMGVAVYSEDNLEVLPIQLLYHINSRQIMAYTVCCLWTLSMMSTGARREQLREHAGERVRVPGPVAVRSDAAERGDHAARLGLPAHPLHQRGLRRP